MNTSDPNNANYTITAACCRHDFITLDSSLESEFVSKLLSNKQLLMAFNSFHVLYQTLGTSNDTTIAVQRAFTRLNKLFCFFAVDAQAPLDTPFSNGTYARSPPRRKMLQVAGLPWLSKLPGATRRECRRDVRHAQRCSGT
jgi:hypothetical protein